MVLTLLVCIGGPQPPLPTFAPEEPATKETTGHATTTVRTDVGWVGPNQQFNIVMLIPPDDGWHVYWQNPGASGAPTEIEIQAPDGFAVGEPVFPRPLVFYGEEGQTFGYSETAAIFVPVTAPAMLSDGQAKFNITTSWLSCKKSCVIGEETKELLVATHALSQGPLNKDMQLSEWMKKLPQPITALENGTCSVVGEKLVISGSVQTGPITFIGIENKHVRFGTPERLPITGALFWLHIPLILDEYEKNDEPLTVRGLLMIGRNGDDPSYVIQTQTKPEPNIF